MLVNILGGMKEIELVRIMVPDQELDAISSHIQFNLDLVGSEPDIYLTWSLLDLLEFDSTQFLDGQGMYSNVEPNLQPGLAWVRWYLDPAQPDSIPHWKLSKLSNWVLLFEWIVTSHVLNWHEGLVVHRAQWKGPFVGVGGSRCKKEECSIGLA